MLEEGSDHNYGQWKAANEKLATKVTLLEKRINELEIDKYRNSVHINNLAVTAKKDN